MGWCGPHNRKEYVAQLMKGWESEGHKVTVRKHHAYNDSYRSKEDWFILDIERPDGTKEAVITVVLWDGSMAKNIDESMGPYCYGCPVEWLDEVSQPEGEWAHNWRMKLRGTPITAK